MTESGDSEKMLSTFLLFFNVFILLIYSSPEDINTLITRLEKSLEFLESKIIEARGQFKYFDKKSIKFRKKINRKLGRKNRTINKYVNCKINNLNADLGLKLRFSFLKNLIYKLRIIYGEYVTDEDEENWTICIMYHEEECIKNAIEYEIEKCYELAHPYPNDFEKLGQMLVGRQVAVFDSNKFFCKLNMKL
ncbi:hypothetical protein KSF78_0009005 [Schistosoma japonicum]|nr:hypothetical protein KSF78_0009005 [Schistosoma japonicum]